MALNPNETWLILSFDLCGSFPLGESLIVYINSYSHYPDVEILHKTTMSYITNKLRKLFCRYGAPEKFVADNGWQFAHNETFDVIMKEFGVTPYHPETNGEIQKDAIKTLKNPSKQLLLLVNSR